MVEQNRLLEEMLARAAASVKELGEQLTGLQGREDWVGLEVVVLTTVLKLGGSLAGDDPERVGSRVG